MTYHVAATMILEVCVVLSVISMRAICILYMMFCQVRLSFGLEEAVGMRIYIPCTHVLAKRRLR